MKLAQQLGGHSPQLNLPLSVRAFRIHDSRQVSARNYPGQKCTLKTRGATQRAERGQTPAVFTLGDARSYFFRGGGG